MPPAFGLNRFDFSSPSAFAADVVRAERLGWDYAFIPSSPLRLSDPYVNLAFAAVQTSRIQLGPLLENPVMRDPAVIASSAATVESLAPGRTLLAYGAGDTAVRLMGRRPAKVAQLEEATILTRRLLAGDKVDVGTARPARLAHARPVPVWIAAGGPRTLEMAGRVADGVFIRVGRHPENIRAACEAIRAGAASAERDPANIRVGIVLHTIFTDDLDSAGLLARSMAAGYYEYAPALFDAPGFSWDGPPIDELKERVWPDFHHASDLESAGRLVSFLSDDIADAFALRGTATMIAGQIQDVLSSARTCGFDVDIVVPHPVPTPGPVGSGPDYMERFATEVIPQLVINGR